MWNLPTVDNGGVSRGSSMAVGISVRWQMTVDIWHVTFHFFSSVFAKKCPKKSQKAPKNANNWLKRSEKCKNVKTSCYFIVLELLSALTKRVCVSCMQDSL